MIRRAGTDIVVTFAGLPMGHEFTSLVLALLQVGGHPSKAAQELIQQIKDIDGDFAFETYFRSEEHTSELQSLMRISYAVFCLKKKNTYKIKSHYASQPK